MTVTQAESKQYTQKTSVGAQERGAVCSGLWRFFFFFLDSLTVLSLSSGRPQTPGDPPFMSSCVGAGNGNRNTWGPGGASLYFVFVFDF